MEHAVYAFCLQGEPVRCVPFGHGHINSTFKIETDQGNEYVLQRINTYVFKDPIGRNCKENFRGIETFLPGMDAGAGSNWKIKGLGLYRFPKNGKKGRPWVCDGGRISVQGG